MKHLYEYNWQVRDEWFELLQNISQEELNKPRVGGLKSFSETLFHIIVVEYYWISGLLGQSADRFQPSDYRSLDELKKLSNNLHPRVNEFISKWSAEMESDIFEAHGPNGKLERFTYGEVMRHVLIHEIHHIGQLSIWARELDLEPVTANFIRRGII